MCLQHMEYFKIFLFLFLTIKKITSAFNIFERFILNKCVFWTLFLSWRRCTTKFWDLYQSIVSRRQNIIRCVCFWNKFPFKTTNEKKKKRASSRFLFYFCFISILIGYGCFLYRSSCCFCVILFNKYINWFEFWEIDFYAQIVSFRNNIYYCCWPTSNINISTINDLVLSMYGYIRTSFILLKSINLFLFSSFTFFLY